MEQYATGCSRGGMMLIAYPNSRHYVGESVLTILR
jgi:hypothetical protein